MLESGLRSPPLLASAGLSVRERNATLLPELLAGIRGTVRLINERNHLAEFQWSPILKSGVTAFSIRPAIGTQLLGMVHDVVEARSPRSEEKIVLRGAFDSIRH